MESQIQLVDRSNPRGSKTLCIYLTVSYSIVLSVLLNVNEYIAN